MDIFTAGEKFFPLGKRTYIMGILNVTPDSFSDGGEYFGTENAIARALQIEQEGAHFLDIGAQSTRPGCALISPDEELQRLLPVLEGLQGKIGIPISVDTFYPEVARVVLQKGASIINDVSGTFQEEIAKAVKEYDGAYIVTHAPKSADKTAEFPEGILLAVRNFFLDCMQKCADCGLGLDRLCLDPGVGFGKSREDDMELIRNAEWVRIAPCPLLFGISRKRITAGQNDCPLDRDPATLAAQTALIAGGADILRVHNVKAAVPAAAMADRIYRS